MGGRRSKAWIVFACMVAVVYVIAPSIGVTAPDDDDHPGGSTAVSCFAIADEGAGSVESDDGDAIEDLLTAVNPDDSDPATNETTIGSTGTFSVESLAFHPDSGTLYGVNGNQLGTFDLETAAFTATASTTGTGSGAEGDVDFDNVDGLAFDPDSATLYGIQREGDDPDLLFVIDPETGSFVPDAFGVDTDYVVVQPVAGLTDIDDIAIDADGKMFAVANEESEGDHLVLVDPATGETDDVGATGVDDVEGLTFAPDARLFGTVGSAGEALVDIDPETGAAGNVRPLDNGRDYEGIACQGEQEPPNCPEVREACNVTGTKFHDTEPLGERNEGDGIIPGVEIHLFNEDLSVHLHTTSASDGFYGFLVEDGTYTLCETVPPEAPTQTFPTEGADCTAHEVGEGQHIGPIGYAITIDAEHPRADDLDFGNGGGGCPEVREACNVTGTKFHDTDPVGSREETEAGIEGVEIHLFNEDGSVHLHTTSASDGFYGFLVEDGTYTVCETQPEGFTQSFPTEGADCTAHEVAEGQTIGPIGYAITIDAEHPRADDLDFGNGGGDVCPINRDDCNVTGVKWDDTNGDGVLDEGEPGLADVEIVLFDSEGAELSRTTSQAPDGFYGFKVEPGSYTLCEVLPEGATQTAPAEGADCAALDPDATLGLAPLGYEVTIVADEVSTGNDFGNVSAVHCSGTANGGHTDGLLLPDTIGQTLFDGGLNIPPLTEDPEHNGILSQPLADLELGLLGTEEIGCLVDLVLDESTGLDP